MSAHETQDDLLSYALGDVSVEAAMRIRSHTSECLECRRELEATSEALGVMGMKEERRPPLHIRARLLKEIHSPRSERPGPRWNTGWFWVPSLASIVLAMISVGLWKQNSALRQELEDSNARVKNPAYQSAVIREAFSAPDAQQFSLLPVNSAPVPQGKAIYRTQQGSVILIGSHFAHVPAGKAYELWLLPASGAPPVPAGVFKPDAAGNVAVVIPHIASSVEAKGFAITMEREAGSATPTMPILLVGNRSQA